MTRAETDFSTRTPDGSHNSEADAAEAAAPSSKLAEFREKLDAYRMRTRAQYPPIRTTSLFGGVRASASREAPRQRAAEEEPGPADHVADARAASFATPESDPDRFEIVLPPRKTARVAMVRRTSSDAGLHASLAAGLAVAALLASGAAIVDSSAPSQRAGSSSAGALAHADATDFPELATASVPSTGGGDGGFAGGFYLSGAELRDLLALRPVKCVLAAPAPAHMRAQASVDHETLRLTASVAEGCVETTTYGLSASTLLRETTAPGGGRIEINAAFSIEGDALCHQTRGLSALVIEGDMPVARARSLETLLNASYADLGGAPICHRLQSMGRAPDGPLFRADAFVDGRRVAERTDPRPFVMKTSAAVEQR